ncbi:hypothetical protein [Nocardiopsis ansamitocini]|uniref:Uncharacterized protein n=1 Tax=Nocardiopsis ansamitocini TaxID=1670832 RepID=A0A9W6UKC2_9ACTN|nr:hypothetical protein [Nocardiopsis ansamitocini]GLU49428.1 hypothetical protein Nans01_37790 [Nocardiopsis ansamitocini]
MSDTPTHLVIDLVSPALFVGHSATGTHAHTDVVTDAHGLPHLPRQRVLALLRMGAVSAALADGSLLAPAHRLFGTARSNKEDRALRLRDAVLDDSVRAAVALALENRAEAARLPLLAAVTDGFTCLESGIEVDQHGAPVPGRLRTVRALLPGMCLATPLSWTREPTEDEVRCLARAALAFTQAGLRTSRGRGRVDARLAKGRDDSERNTRTLAWAGLAREETP